MILSWIVTIQDPDYKQYFPSPFRKSGHPATCMWIFHHAYQIEPLPKPSSKQSLFLLSQNDRVNFLWLLTLYYLFPWAKEEQKSRPFYKEVSLLNMKAGDRTEKKRMVLKEMLLEAMPCLFRQSSKSKTVVHLVPNNFQLPQENNTFSVV